MKITRKDFERAIRWAYKDGVNRPSTAFVSTEDVAIVIKNIYKLFEHESNASQPGVEEGRANAELECTCSAGNGLCLLHGSWRYVPPVL